MENKNKKIVLVDTIVYRPVVAAPRPPLSLDKVGTVRKRRIKNNIIIYNLLVLAFFSLIVSAYSINKSLSQKEKIAQGNSPGQAVLSAITSDAKGNINDEVLLIPRLSISAPIIPIESRNNDDVMEGLKKGVVRYGQTVNPGEKGNSFIIGHSSDYPWKEGNYKQIFANLDKLGTGDSVVAQHNGKKFNFVVTGKKIVEPNDMSTLEQTAEPTMTLMTCWPPGTTDKRLVVILRLQ